MHRYQMAEDTTSSVEGYRLVGQRGYESCLTSGAATSARPITALLRRLGCLWVYSQLPQRMVFRRLTYGT